MIKKLLSLGLLVSFTFAVFSQPTGYFNNAAGKTGAELKTALYDIIKGHTARSYSNLWTDFQSTDKKSNGKVWDMYSDKPGQTPPYEFTFITEQCGTYSNEGDCYNREHSFPKSWFNDDSPMYSDLFHLYPTDGKVNGMRSNFPFGEVSFPTSTSLNGSKLGPSSYSGYSGTVFEPIDDYKGDFARSYFYMVTRYQDVLSSWNTDMLDGSTFPAFSTWAKNMLLEWHQQDPVSQKEIDRNNAVYGIQHNRNPFIDHPEYAEAVWSSGPVALSFTGSPLTTATINQPYTYSVSVAGPVGSTFTITLTTKPAWLTLTNSSNGHATLSGTPTAAGSFDVILSVTDGISTKTQTFAIQVAALEGLKFTSSPTLNATAGSLYNYNVTTSDNANPSATITITTTTKPDWLSISSISNGTATLNGTPQPAHAGANSVTLTATDGSTTITQAFIITVGVAGVGKIETFTNMPANASNYSQRLWVGDNSINWTASSARTDETINSRAICLAQTASTYLLSGTVSGGCSQITFKHQQKYNGSGGSITLFINDQQIGSPVSVTTAVQTAVINNINVTGNFTIKLVSNGASRIAIDDLSWAGAIAVTNISPLVTNITNAPLNPTTSQIVTISAAISDSDGTIQEAWFDWGNTINNLANRVNLTLTSGNYVGAIPAQSQAGTIFVSISAKDNLFATTSVQSSFVVSPSTNVNNEEGKSRVKVYPNPAKNQINVEVQEIGLTKITVSNIIGETLISLPSSSGKQPIDISRLKSGVYFVIVMGDDFRSTHRIVKY